MSKKYIPQIPNNDFVYPNNDRVEYDVTIVHDINDNCPTGSISGLTITSNTGTTENIDLSYYYNWNLNGATPFKRQSGNISILSVHMMLPNQDYFKPWRMVDSISNSTPTTTEQYGTRNALDISPADFGVTYFPQGEYTFEFRLIGEECVTVICATATYNPVNPTPTPSPTFGYPTPTPTPTPTATGVIPTPTPTPTANTCTTWRISTPSYSGESIVGEYIDCDGTVQSFEYYWNSGTYYLCVQVGSMVIYDYGIDGNATDTFNSCT
jgi:hypothetical protein